MRIIGLVSALVLVVSGGFSKVHPLKMSFSKLVISSEGVVDLRSRIFLDDITAQIQALYNLEQVDFSTVESEATQALQRYLTDHLYFEQAGKKSSVEINAVSFSRNRLALEVHMSAKNSLDVTKELFLTNTILCDASPKQKNDLNYLENHLRSSSSNPRVQIQFE